MNGNMILPHNPLKWICSILFVSLFKLRNFKTSNDLGIIKSVSGGSLQYSNTLNNKHGDESISKCFRLFCCREKIEKIKGILLWVGRKFGVVFIFQSSYLYSIL